MVCGPPSDLRLRFDKSSSPAQALLSPLLRSGWARFLRAEYPGLKGLKPSPTQHLLKYSFNYTIAVYSPNQPKG